MWPVCLCACARAPERARKRAYVDPSQAINLGYRSRAEEGMGSGGEKAILVFYLN